MTLQDKESGVRKEPTSGEGLIMRQPGVLDYLRLRIGNNSYVDLSRCGAVCCDQAVI